MMYGEYGSEYGRGVDDAIREYESNEYEPSGADREAVYKVPVYWTMFGYVTVTASSPDEAMEKVSNNIDDYDLPNGEYLDDSFSVDESGEAFVEPGAWS